MKAKVKPESKVRGLTFQDLILKLSQFWIRQGCVLQQPYDVEVGAGTMHPETFLRVLGPAAYRVAYAQPSRRPADGRYGDNPNRLYKHLQFQVILKPAPIDVQDVYQPAENTVTGLLAKRSVELRSEMRKEVPSARNA